MPNIGFSISPLTTNSIIDLESAITGAIASTLTEGSNIDITSYTISVVNNPQFTAVTASDGFIRNNLLINGTASIAYLETRNQTQLNVGDKYIVILNSDYGHSLDGAGIQWGSGSTGPLVDNFGSNAHVRYDSVLHTLNVHPSMTGIFSGTFSGSIANLIIPACTSSNPVGIISLNGRTPVVVSSSLARTGSLIFATKQTFNHINGHVGVANKNNGSFTIVSSIANDNDTVAYMIVNT